MASPMQDGADAVEGPATGNNLNKPRADQTWIVGAAHHVDLAKVQTQQENRLWPFFSALQIFFRRLI